MLLQFYAENYRSILEPVILSMLADEDLNKKKYHEEITIPSPHGSVLPVSLIYGPNGSGKTSFLKAIACLQSLAAGSTLESNPSLFCPHKLAAKEQTTKFEIYFLTRSRTGENRNETLFCYGLEYSRNGIAAEYLNFWPNKRKACIFSRSHMEVSCGSRFRLSSFSAGRKIMTPFRTLLSCLADSGCPLPEIQEAFRWLKEDLIILFSTDSPDCRDYALSWLSENQDSQTMMLRALQAFGVPIQNLHMKESDVTLQYETFSVSIEEESSGIRRLFFLSALLLAVLQTGKSLLADGLENGLHPLISERMIQAFQENGKQQKSQLLCTTHNTELLDLGILRKDQIWFTECPEERRCTDLYALLDIRDVRPSENIRIGYLKGKYGALPSLHRSFPGILSRDEPDGQTA